VKRIFSLHGKKVTLTHAFFAMAELQKFAKKGETQKKCNMGRPRGDRGQKLVLASRSPKIAENQHFSNFSLPAGRDMFAPPTDSIRSCSGHP